MNATAKARREFDERDQPIPRDAESRATGKSPVPARVVREGETGHNVRYVLAWSTVICVIAFIIAAAYVTR